MSLPLSAPDAAASQQDVQMSAPQSNELTRQKIAAIIEEQFDLEILLRHAERASIAQELAKAERMLEDLRHAILSERQGAPFGNSTFSRSQGVPTTGTRGRVGRRATANYGSNGRQPEAIYAVRADGQFVRLGCPRCDRYDFGSQQGLINHMRLSHKHFFKSTEDCVRYCGVVVPSSEVPPDHPCRTRVVFSSLNMNDPSFQQANDFKPTIKTYDEDVDLDLDDGHKAGNQKPFPTAPGSASQQQQQQLQQQPPQQVQQQQQLQQKPQPRSRKNSTSSMASSSNGESGSDSDTSGEEDSSGISRRRSSLALAIHRPQKGKPKSGLQLSNGVNGPLDDTDGTSGTEVDADDIQKPRQPAGKGPMRKYGGSGISTSTSTGRSSLPPPPLPPPLPAPPIQPQRDVSMDRQSRVSSVASSRAASPDMHRTIITTTDAVTTQSKASRPVLSAPTSSAATTQPGIIVQASVPTPPAAEGVPIITFGPSAVYADVPTPLDTVGSRFYVKRRIVVGNVSKYLPEHKRDPRLKDFSYKWMIYVDGTPSPEDITAYVHKVEFHLHESYKPNHIVAIEEPPFHLSRYAWGETTVKIMLYFKDERNKPVEVFHKLALDPTHCGRQVLGNERSVDLELDRNTEFKPIAPFQKRAKDGNKGSSGSGGGGGGGAGAGGGISSSSSLAQAQARAMILHTKADVAMADALTDDKIDEDERELQDTFQKDVAGQRFRLAMQQQQQQNVESVRAASTSLPSTEVAQQVALPFTQQQQQPQPQPQHVEQHYQHEEDVIFAGLELSTDMMMGGMATSGFYQTRVAATRLKYCKACGSPWQKHREAAVGVVGLESTTPFLNRENNAPIPNCPHHPSYYATKDNLTVAGTAANLMTVDGTLSLPMLASGGDASSTSATGGKKIGRTKKRFALDMLKECGIVDERGHPILSRLQQQQQQMRHQMAAAARTADGEHQTMMSMMMTDEDQDMDLDVGDSELGATTTITPSSGPDGDGGGSGRSSSTAPLVVMTPLQLERLEDAFQRLPVYEGRRSEIDWVLSVMDDLRLKTLALDGVPVGSGRMMVSMNQQQQSGGQQATPGSEQGQERMQQRVDESIRQRAVIGGLLVQATKGFLHRILSKAVDVHRRESKAERGPAALMMELDEDDQAAAASSQQQVDQISKKLLAPHHIRQALELHPEELDFLTNDYEDMRGVSDAMAGL